MKENLRRLQLIFRLTRLKPEMFYSINVTESGLHFQGKFSGEKVNEVKKLFTNFCLSSNGYVEFSRCNLEITLTE